MWTHGNNYSNITAIQHEAFYKCSERYIRSLEGPSTLSLIPPSTLHCIIMSAFPLQPSSPLQLVYPVPLPQEEALPEESDLYKGMWAFSFLYLSSCGYSPSIIHIEIFSPPPSPSPSTTLQSKTHDWTECKLSWYWPWFCITLLILCLLVPSFSF